MLRFGRTTCMNNRIRLNRIEHPPITLHFSPGYDAHAHEVGAIVARAYRWLAEWLGVEMRFTLSVLRRHNWEVMRRVPYGYPHSNASRMTIFVPARYPPRVVARLETLVESADDTLREAVVDGLPSLEAAIVHFLDLVAVHELAHLFIAHLQLELGAKWLHEFVADLFATAYFSDGAPETLPFWLSWARMQAAQTVTQPSLETYEANRDSLDFATSNYFQGKFNLWAYDVWRREGRDVAPRLVAEFSYQPETLKQRLEGVIGPVEWL
jgi:hypothetical protein